MEIGLALGSGGVKGNAHLGVLKVLQENSFEIKAIAGTSAGGLIGAVYLSGYSPEEIQKILESVDQSDLFKHGDEEQPSMMGLEGMHNLLLDLIGEKTFEDLEIPFAVTAVDIKNGKAVVIKNGSLVEAVMATIAIPGVFPAKEINGQLLVDGGIYNPVPVDVVRKLVPRLPIVAVPLSSMPEEEDLLPDSNIFGDSPVLKRITRFRFAKALSVFLRSMDISTRLMTEMRLQVDKPDVIIRPDVYDISALDKVNISEVIKLGEDATNEVLPELLKAVRWDNRLKKLIGLN